jgi:hypothetical protein
MRPNKFAIVCRVAVKSAGLRTGTNPRFAADLVLFIKSSVKKFEARLVWDAPQKFPFVDYLNQPSVLNRENGILSPSFYLASSESLTEKSSIMPS